MKKIFIALSLLLFMSCQKQIFEVQEIAPPRINPNGNYLTALLSYSTTLPSILVVEREDYGVVAQSGKSNTHLLPVINLNPDTKTTLTLKFLPVKTQTLADIKAMSPEERNKLPKTKTIKLNIPPVGSPPFVPEITILKEDVANKEGLYLITKQGYNYLIDKQGSVLWANDSMNFFLRQLPNNHFLTLGKPAIEYQSKVIYEVDLAGTIYRKWVWPNSFHHDVIYHDGGLIAPSNSQPLPGSLKSPYIEDTLIYLDENAIFKQEIDFNDIFTKDRKYVRHFSSADDWVHTNALGYSPTLNQISVSLRNQSAVVGLDITKEGKDMLQWIIAPENYPSPWPAELEAKRLKIADEDTPHGPHVTRWMQNGNLLIYDNGIERENEYSRAVEYKLDLDAGTAEIVRQFDYDKQLYSPITGDVHELDQETWSVFFAYVKEGKAYRPSRLMEVNPSTDEVLWEVEIARDSPNEVYYRALPVN